MAKGTRFLSRPQCNMVSQSNAGWRGLDSRGSQCSKHAVRVCASRPQSHSQACLTYRAQDTLGLISIHQSQKSQSKAKKARMTGAVWRTKLAYRGQCQRKANIAFGSSSSWWQPKQTSNPDFLFVVSSILRRSPKRSLVINWWWVGMTPVWRRAAISASSCSRLSRLWSAKSFCHEIA